MHRLIKTEIAQRSNLKDKNYYRFIKNKTVIRYDTTEGGGTDICVLRKTI